jgi:aminoglycoside 3-N-acetyltransferase
MERDNLTLIVAYDPEPMITGEDIASALSGLGVGPSDTLFVHSGLHSALRVEGESAHEKLSTIVGALESAVPDGALILPTFTYSFCEGEPFDLRESPSTVGALTEHFRSLPGTWRTADPIFSCAVRGALPASWEHRLRALGDKDCFGADSVFAYLLEAHAKLLFIGVGFEYCTFVHHVEQGLPVPYRHIKEFRGVVRDGAERAEVRADYFVRNLDEDVETWFDPLAERLAANGHARAEKLPRGPGLLVVEAAAVAAEATAGIAANPDFLLRRGHR